MWVKAPNVLVISYLDAPQRSQNFQALELPVNWVRDSLKLSFGDNMVSESMFRSAPISSWVGGFFITSVAYCL